MLPLLLSEASLPEGGGTGMDGIISTLTSGVTGIFNLAGQGFDFITGNDLCMLMVGLSFAGAALGLVGRAFKVSRK